MKTIQVKSFQEIDALIAQQLGWVKSSFEEECSQFTPGAQWNYGTDWYTIKVELLFPTEVVEEGLEEEWIDNHYHWCAENGGAPLFSSNWDDTEVLLQECDCPKGSAKGNRCGKLVEWSRNSEITSCSIKQIDNTTKAPLIAYTGSPFGIPKSMPLATSLAWLLWHNIKIEFNLA